MKDSPGCAWCAAFILLFLLLLWSFHPEMQKDMADGAAAKVMGTPTLFVNGKRLHDRSFEGFKKLIQEELAGRQKAPASPRAAPAKKAQAGAGRPGGH